ncbi:MAG: 1-acyl-sn-glycerol-3-phosphate acyltransferase [Cyanobacteria bacterium RM1_2_2]|nr:1-acyl-sn-glycerol-3-phosphate acyltransferase [Cyanobacteria bacterium RM1_2_2]
MPEVITHVQPPLEFIPPNFNPIIYRTGQVLLPAWLRWRIQITDVQVHHTEKLVELYQQFQAGKIRFLMAFRHPSVNDPYSLYYLLSRCVPQVAKQAGVSLQPPIHAHFIYDRGIPLWAGKPIGWLFSELGGTPIRRGKVDVPGLRSIRQLFVDGQFPLAAAPEGATNGHTEIVSPIEPGIAQFGFWCAEDLHKAGRSETVLIVPIGIRYHYISEPWPAIDELLSQLETDCGLPRYGAESEPATLAELQIPLADPQRLLYKRLLRLSEHLLTLMEQFYSKFYHQPLKSMPSSEGSFNQHIEERLQALLNAALTVAEQHFALSPKGSLTDRCRRLEQAGWERIFREDLGELEQLPLAERGLADRIAEEADLRLWHMRLVESFVSVTGHYILEKPTADRFAETLLLLWDTVTRLKGENPNPRPCLGSQRVEVTIEPPISVSDRWHEYQTGRRQAVASLTQVLQTALEQTIS